MSTRRVARRVTPPELEPVDPTAGTAPAAPAAPFDYDTAFARNLGLVSDAEQVRLRRACVALPGLGGVGSAHVQALARMGVGALHLADPDRFELGNVQRQLGATRGTLGRRKVDALAADAAGINPEIRLRLFPDGLHEDNAEVFLDGVDVVVDGIEFFALGARRLLYRACRRRRIPVVNAGPIGYGAAVVVFLPEGPTFEEFFHLDDGLTEAEALTAFALGLGPGLKGDIDPGAVDVEARRGPALASACMLCAGTAATEVMKLVTGRGRVLAAPRGVYFDPYRGRTLPLRPRPPLRRSVRGRLLRKLSFHRFPQLRAMHQREAAATAQGGLAAAIAVGPAPDPAAGTDARTLAALRTLAAAAVRAPSGDNTQPWRLRLDPAAGTIELHLDHTRDLSPMNGGQRMARIACGAALESMVVRAEGLGWAVDVAAAPAHDPGLGAVRLGAAPADPSPPEDELLAARTTNRRLYDGRPLAPETLEALADAVAAAGIDGVAVVFVHERRRIHRLAAAVAAADAVMLGEPTMRAAFLDKVRFDALPDAPVAEGLPLGALEASTGQALALRALRHMPDRLVRVTGAAGALAEHARRLVESASGLCVVAAPDREPATDVRVGRAVLRAWLALGGAGLAVHPMMSAPVLDGALEHGSETLIASLGAERARAAVEGVRALLPEVGRGRVAFVLRFGVALPPTARTGRRGLEEVIE